MSRPAIEKYRFETGVYRPPSEGGSHSLLLRLTRNCPWNQCAFCAMYKGEKFEVRPVAEIKQDIDAIAALCEDLRTLGQRLGAGGGIDHQAIIALITQVPDLDHHPGLAMVFNWLTSGAGTVFLQDANSLIMKTEQLVEVLQYLRGTFPSIHRITTYARSRTLVQKSAEALKAIREAGLDRLHVGLETGDEVLLKKIRKGVTPQGHIEGGRKAVQAGFQLSEYWMPGLGGRAMWEAHAIGTARVLNAINPHYIRSRPFYPLPGTKLSEELRQGGFELLSAEEQLLELKLMITHLDVGARVCFDHAGNYWKDRNRDLLFSHSYEGYQFPGQKQEVLERIAEGLKARNRRPNLLNL
jgi:radical SAM superfamily enzyme YgiQ (UPF0313 family)